MEKGKDRLKRIGTTIASAVSKYAANMHADMERQERKKRKRRKKRPEKAKEMNLAEMCGVEDFGL